MIDFLMPFTIGALFVASGMAIYKREEILRAILGVLLIITGGLGTFLLFVETVDHL